MVFYIISGKVYVVCISSNEIFTAYTYEVQLKLSGSVIEDLTLMGPLIEIGLNSSSPSNMSNFVFVEHKVYFAIDNTIIAMDVLDSMFTWQYSGLPDCTQMHKIVPVSDSTIDNHFLLVVFCTDRYTYFDPTFGDWTII